MANPLKYAPEHTEHGDDCMSEWAELRRYAFTPETIAANHRLHMADVNESTWFECPYHYTRHPENEILTHMRREHPNAWPGVRAALSGHLAYIDHRYNGPAED